VDDTGCGIDAEHLPHLFERFYRAEGHRARTSGGTGLGLSIALSIVRAHGGWIDVASTPGEGTNFTVWLPQRDLP
jgi:signal transduction histidine kinase